MHSALASEETEVSALMEDCIYMKIEEEGMLKERYTYPFLFHFLFGLFLVIRSHHLPHASDQE